MNPSGEDDRTTSSGWWKPVAVLGAAVLGGIVAWGWLKPAPESPDPTESISEEIEGHTRPAMTTGTQTAGAAAVTSATARERAPAWVRPTILWAIVVAISIMVGLTLLGVMREVVGYLILALFFSFAMEPAVNYAQSRWHWKRGATTGGMCALVLVMLLLLVAIVVPTVLKGAAAIAERIPQSAASFSAWLSDKFGIDVSTASLEHGAEQAATSLNADAQAPMSALFGFTVSLVGGLFALFTVGMFVYYMVAQAPRFKRAVLGFFNLRRQEELLAIWESAIEKTGGYFYSKLLLAGINGGLMFIVLRLIDVPGAAALAFFQGVVAAFIPIVGTYIAAIVPILVAFMTVGWQGALIALIYVLVYQQVENYLISPRIQGKTMQLHPAVAFGAALAGGALGGILWAFLALPFAATVQASASLWIQRHEVVESELTAVEEPRPARERAERNGSLVKRGGRWLSSTRGWIRSMVHRGSENGDGASPPVGAADRASVDAATGGPVMS